MLNNNYYTITGTVFGKLVNTQLTKTDGEFWSTFQSSYAMLNKASKNTTEINKEEDGIFALVGSGTTPATSEDFKLESALGLQVFSNSIGFPTKGATLSYSRAFRNDTAEPVTVNELGMYMCSKQAGNVMFAREVFDTPVVIEPGESKTFTFVLK